MIKKNPEAFTMIEVMIGILIFSIVIIGGFQALMSVQVGKPKLMGEIDMEKESFYFTEKLFELIKQGGSLDFEEYFNRKVVGNDTYSGGHYALETGFGNFGPSGIVGTSNYGGDYYHCISGNGVSMGVDGCYSNIYNNLGASQLGTAQRYGQYSFQFIDYNSNLSADSGDEDGDGFLIGDEDDEYLGKGPDVFSSGLDVKELYLISGNKKRRTLIRWHVKQDPKMSTACNFGTGKTPTGNGCLGTIEFLELEGKDWGLNHNPAIPFTGLYDGVVDTWVVNQKYSGTSDIVAGSDANNYRVPLFPDTINVKNFEVYAYPNKDINHAWADGSSNLNISPYVRLSITIGPRRIPDGSSDIQFSTSISLTDIFSK